MKSKITRKLSSLLYFLAVALLLLMHASAEEILPTQFESAEIIANGVCGTTASWYLDTEGTMTICGTGKMYNYPQFSTPWENYKTEIKNVIITPGVTSLGNYSFSFCSYLENIEISDSVTSIGSGCFQYCTRLQKFFLPESVSSIGPACFDNCSKLKHILLPTNLSQISDNCFSACIGLEKITLPYGVQSIGDASFSGCTNLAYIEIPSGITKLGSGCFYNCSSLKSIDLPESLLSIGDACFSSCSSLISISIPNGIKSLGTYCFYKCGQLKNLRIADSVVSIGDYCFSECSSLMSITIPAGVTALGTYCLSCPNDSYEIKKIIFLGDAPSINYNAFNDVLAYVYYYDNTFGWANVKNQKYGGSLAWISLPENSLIASGTCGENLTWKLNRTGTLTISGTGQMDNFPNVNAPWMDYTADITHVIIEAGVTTIGKYSFYGCNSLTTVEIPSGIVSIGDYCFMGCTNLTWINLPEGIMSIGYSCFSDCSSLISISIPNGIAALGDYFFYNCKNLFRVTLPESVTSIGSYCFYTCSSLTDITIPQNVSSIGFWAFASSGLSCITFTSHDLPSFDADALRSTNQLTITYPCTWVDIAPVDSYSSGNALWNVKHADTEIANARPATRRNAGYTGNNICTACKITLTEGESTPEWHNGDFLILPKDLQTIGSEAFRNSSAQYIILPDTATSIAPLAFADCSQLEFLEIPASVYSIADDAFSGSSYFSIIAEEGSYAQWWANQNTIPCICELFD